MEALSLERTPVCLEVVSGPAAGQYVPLDEDIRFGCEEAGAGTLGGDRWLSRAHAAIHRGATGQFEVEDLGSLEGTAVNGRSVREPHQLNYGDVIELGSTRMVVRELNAAPAEPRPQTPAAGYTAPTDSRRVLAAIVDGIIEAGVAYGAIQVFASLVIERGTNVVYAGVGFLLAAQLTYRFLCESLVGQTLGKRLLGIRVVRMDGRPLDPNAALIRTVLLFIDGWLLIGLVAMVITGRRRRRRIGDLAAGTIVVPAATPHPGFARRDRDQLMLASPILWLVTIAVLLRVLGPGLQGCQDAGVAPPVANEGACLELIHGLPVELHVVNAGHKLTLPQYDITLERTAVTRRSAFRTQVSFELAVTTNAAATVPFGADPSSVQLWVPSDGGIVPVPADRSPRLVGVHRIAAVGAPETAWVTFTIPAEAVGSLTYPTADLAFLAGDTRHAYLGEIRLWRVAGQDGTAALAGLTR